jgi:hypothetical protein
MLWTIYTLSLALWLIGMITNFTFGGWIHLLMGVALVCFGIHITLDYRKDLN